MGIDLKLEEFSGWVAEKPGRVKVPYRAWRILAKWQKNEAAVKVELSPPSDDTLIIHNRLTGEEIEFYIFTEEGFGKWVYDKLFNKPKIKIATMGLGFTFKEYNTFKMEEKGEDNMKILNNSKFNFGTCENDNVRLSLYGLAVKNAEGTWVSYDSKNDAVMDADILNFDGGKFLFKMPVALKDIKEGDIIIHNRVPMFVKTVSEDNRIVAIDPHAGEEKIVMLTKSCFGFDFATKVVSLFKLGDNVATPDAPFGNMLPFLLMGEDKGDIDPMAMCMMMQQNGDFMSNPMMMYLMLKDKGNMNDMLPFMFMMNANK